MYGTLSLNGTWGLTWAEGHPLMNPDHYTAAHLRGRQLMPAAVPAPIHRVLMDAGLIEDINYGLNSLKARWVEEQFWIYRHTFQAPPEACSAPAWLVFQRLELDAVVWLNGREVGRHANAHRPARFDVTGQLEPGENLLVVRVSTGMHATADRPVAEYSHYHMDMLTRRPWLRKPQYQCGWDWNPRLVNVGILGDVRLEWSTTPRLNQAAVFAVAAPDLASATITVRADVQGVGEPPVPVELEAVIQETGERASVRAEVRPGDNLIELALPVRQPRLWWPVGHGEQHLYTVQIRLSSGGDVRTLTRRTGVRRVEIDRSPHPVTGEYFILKVNHRPVFCKGGNWVPADMLYSTVTPERYRRLVDIALEAHFNLLRVWGGGTFADHALCDACDEAGVLIWHDFLFACAKYPGDEPEFAAEVRREVTWAARELAHHPSLVVWCGNNEIEWGDWHWGYDDTRRTHPHYAMFHHDIPMIARRENPSAAYWLSSPYSPDFLHPNDPTVGDQHPWDVSILAAGGADWWKYRDYVDRFPNEGGILGASSPATLRQFLPPGQQHPFSPAWDHHDNPMACTSPAAGELGRAYATLELWLGRDPQAMDLDDFAFCSALCQAEGLTEYILNYRRRMFSSAAAVFWMYNDSWPASLGWTIVDYYLRRKLCFHPVRRAFAPVTVVVTADDREVTVYGVNDTPGDVSGDLRCGLFTLHGERPLDLRRTVRLPANASTELARFDRDAWERLDTRRSGAFAALSAAGRAVAQHRLFVQRFKDLDFAEPAIRLNRRDGVLTLESPVFAWGVCLDLDGELPLADNCFDLLPGIPYAVPWPDGLPEPRVLRVGSRDAVRRR